MTLTKIFVVLFLFSAVYVDRWVNFNVGSLFGHRFLQFRLFALL